MQKLFGVVRDLKGNVVEGATVEVQDYPAGTLSTIYSDNGSTAATNPLTTDDEGYFEYYAANGNYIWVITTDTDEKTINDIQHYDPP